MNSPILNDVEFRKSGSVIFVQLPDVNVPCPTTLGTYTEPHVFDWTHPEGDKTVLIIGVEDNLEFAGYEVRVFDGGEWIQHESGSVGGQHYREFVDEDGEFEAAGFEAHLAVALA